MPGGAGRQQMRRIIELRCDGTAEHPAADLVVKSPVVFDTDFEVPYCPSGDGGGVPEQITCRAVAWHPLVVASRDRRRGDPDPLGGDAGDFGDTAQDARRRVRGSPVLDPGNGGLIVAAAQVTQLTLSESGRLAG
jgi:hypothetical protein